MRSAELKPLPPSIFPNPGTPTEGGKKKEREEGSDPKVTREFTA